jgi:dihydrofolate reductase
VQVVGGPGVVRQLLQAGLVDELHLDVMPVLLGTGLRFLDDPGLEGIGLEKLGVQELGARTSPSFRVRR